MNKGEKSLIETPLYFRNPSGFHSLKTLQVNLMTIEGVAIASSEDGMVVL